MASRGCQSRYDFARYVLIEGLREEASLGVNPYRQARRRQATFPVPKGCGSSQTEVMLR